MMTLKERNAQIKRLEKMTDEEIYQNALSDPDCPLLTEKELKDFVRIIDMPGDTLAEKRRNSQKILSSKANQK